MNEAPDMQKIAAAWHAAANSLAIANATLTAELNLARAQLAESEKRLAAIEAEKKAQVEAEKPADK